MKKVLLAVAMVAFALTSNAQLFVGGSLWASTESGKNCSGVSGVDDTKGVTSMLGFNPKVGFELSDKFAVGATVSLSTSKTIADKEADKNVWTKSNTWGISPFARYTVLSFGKFNVKGEAVARFTMSSPKTNDGKEKTKGNTTTTIGLSVTPILSYSISDHFDIETSMNFLSFNASHSVMKNASNKDAKYIDNSIGFNATSYDIATLGSITLGFIYKF